MCLTCFEDRAACIKHLRDGATRCLEIWCEIVQPHPPDDPVVQALEREETDANRVARRAGLTRKRITYRATRAQGPLRRCAVSVRGANSRLRGTNHLPPPPPAVLPVQSDLVPDGPFEQADDDAPLEELVAPARIGVQSGSEPAASTSRFV